MAEGAAWSTGSTLARMSVNSLFGGSSQHHPAVYNEGKALRRFYKHFAHILSLLTLAFVSETFSLHPFN
jgi:hypothetical protein